MRGFIFIVLSMIICPAYAQQVELKMPCPDIVVNKQISGAEYQAGIDVHGKPVAPADLKSAFKDLNYPIRIPVELDVINFLDLNVPGALTLGQAQGVVPAYFDVFEDGRVEFNGQDISSSVAQSCDDGKEPEMLTETEERANKMILDNQKDGQAEPVPLTSSTQNEDPILKE